MNIKIRKANDADITAIMQIYESARQFMRSRGNETQWGNSYPSRALIEEDIVNNSCYVGVNDNNVLFVFVFITDAEPTYSSIDGKWLNDKPYGTIHRIASSGEMTGVVKRTVNFCLTKTDNIRIDTHSKNLPMQKVLADIGFTECGVIHLSDGSPRVAFQLTTEQTQEWRKMINGEVYDAAYPPIIHKLEKTREKIWQFNQLCPSDKDKHQLILHELLGSYGKSIHINPPFRCDYGCNIHIGERFFANFNLTILDEAIVSIGDDVFIGPNVSIYTACHSTNVEDRNSRKEWAKSVTIGNNVWIGGGATILPGVTIGNGVTIGAGSVVTKNIPDNTIVAGNPAKVIRRLN